MNVSVFMDVFVCVCELNTGIYDFITMIKYVYM